MENGDDLDASGYLEEAEAESHEGESFDEHEEPEEVSHDLEDASFSLEGDSEGHVEGEDVTEESGPSIVVSPSPPAHEELAHELEVETDAPHDAPEHPEDTLARGEAQTVNAAQHGLDIDDIVNLLETKPTISVSKPQTFKPESVPEDAPDIPDEE